MEFIAHRINTVEQLKKIPTNFGVELDLRENGNRLILQHDPFVEGELFSDYLKQYRHGTMIVNIKSEGLEPPASELLKKAGIEKYFFLDSSFPMIIKLSRLGERRIAVRYSEYEHKNTALAVKNMVSWIWIDCFNIFPLDRETYNEFRAAGLNLCVVSPELQGRQQDIGLFTSRMQNEGMRFDAVCSKFENSENWTLTSA